jgi:hypothetical protein
MRTLRFPEADPYGARVLESFVEAGGSLRGIPVQREKRLVVLRWLVDEELMQRRSGIYWRTGSVPNVGHDPASWPLAGGGP